MHYGAPVHSRRPVQAFLNETFPPWAVCGSHNPWPVRTLDLNPLDFFLWGYMNMLSILVNYKYYCGIQGDSCTIASI